MCLAAPDIEHCIGRAQPPFSDKMIDDRFVQGPIGLHIAAVLLCADAPISLPFGLVLRRDLQGRRLMRLGPFLLP